MRQHNQDTIKRPITITKTTDQLIEDYQRHSNLISWAEAARQLIQRGINDYLRERSAELQRNSNSKTSPDDVPPGLAGRTNSLTDRSQKTIKLH